MLRRFEVADDSGMMALVDPDAYISHIGWQGDLDQIGGHFVAQMEHRTMLIWPTGRENIWPVEVTTEPRSFNPRDVRRQETGLIRCTQGRLLVTNYESLTMAASYADETPAMKYEKDEVIELPPGLYTCQATLLWPGYFGDGEVEDDRDDDDDAGEKFVLVITPGGDGPPWRQAPWDRPDFHDD